MVVAPGQMILGPYLARINDGRAEKNVPVSLALIKGVVLIANRIAFDLNTSFQGFRIQIKSAQFGKAFLVMEPLLEESHRYQTRILRCRVKES